MIKRCYQNINLENKAKMLIRRIVSKSNGCTSFIFYRLYNNKCGLALWSNELDTNIKLDIEKYWKDKVFTKLKERDNVSNVYILPMFPYPSGNLHMGHVRVYSLSDTLARFYNMSQNNVVHPMGWDAFGLPAENAAIMHKVIPSHWTKTNIGSMKKQLQDLGLHFDWSRELCTCDPDYYKWTQYIFLKLFENGLAYQKKDLVNWDPVDQTVLAEEQVDDLGCSWRSGAKVEKKLLTQWFIKTTKFAKQLYDGLSDNSLENWKDIVNLQQHWIGPCNGIVVTFELHPKSFERMHNLDVWTSDPYKFIHGDFLTVNSENILAKQYLDSTISGNKLPIIAYNPVSERKMPIYVSSTIEYPEGRDVYLGCSYSSKEDMKLAESLNIPIGKCDINSESDSLKAIKIAQMKNVGGHWVSSKLRDWLISRQRYWGTPIPIIHCHKCGVVPVPYDNLPVELPQDNCAENGINTLDKMKNWVKCKCPSCHGTAKRETDTMDTFVDSSWYYYRFLDPNNKEMPFDKNKFKDLLPVSIYIGGKEHAVLHLYYARFMSYFFNSLQWIDNKEPFKKLLVQGMVMGKSYKLKSTGKYIPENEVELIGKEYKEKETGEPLIVDWEKMSKSKFNGVNPENLLTTYGCDTTRLFMLSDVAPPTSRHWSNSTFPGVLNWQKRLWMTISELHKYRNDITLKSSNTNSEEFKAMENKIWKSRNHFIATATYHFKYTQMISVGIAQLHGLTKLLRSTTPEVIYNSGEYELALANLIIMMTPTAPHFCSELWSGFLLAPNRINNNSSSIDWQKDALNQCWPVIDDDYELSFLCKVDGADSCELRMKPTSLKNLTQDDALNIMLKEKQVLKRLKKGILKTKFELYPECRGILHIYANKTVTTKDEKE